MGKYYISNDIRFVQGFGNLMDSMSSATHMKHHDAQRYISNHPGYVMIRTGNKHKYIISTPQKFIAQNGEISQTMSDAICFNSAKDAFKYIDDHPDLSKTIENIFVINDSYKKCRRNQLIKQEVQSKNIELQHKLNVNNSDRIVFSKQTKRLVLDKYNGVCPLCGEAIQDNDVSIDHIIPLSRGGTNDLDNLRPTHAICNRMKNNYTDDEFFGKVSSVACNYIYNSPTSQMATKLIRSMVRGIIYNSSRVENQWRQ